mgnify:CR=1 FL=1
MNNSFSIKTKLVKSKEYLFDELRKKWIMSTPEELVRQKFWKYLNIEKKYPMSLIAIEKQIKINGLNKRFDILMFSFYLAVLFFIDMKTKPCYKGETQKRYNEREIRF